MKRSIGVSRHLHGRRRIVFGTLALAFVLATGAVSSWAIAPDALPTGGRITSGQGAITQSGSQMTVTQQSDKLIANWSTFHIGRDAGVNFLQPGASSVALNRIQDQNPSRILGSLTANGRIFLLNPSGIIFGQSARVDVGSLVASSLDLSDENFLAGKYRFQSSLPDNASPGAISNSGAIRTADGGCVAFLSPHITNEGSIKTPGGTIAMAAGNKINLDFTGDGLVSFTIEQGAIDALAQNKGLIQADGGAVYLSAKAADALRQSVVNNDGIIAAMGITTNGGRIVLDAAGGQTTISGTLDASSQSAQGGRVVATGERVQVRSGALLNASGATGGGEVLVGGGWQGSDPAIRQAVGTVIETGANLQANATDTGNGGTVVAWSDVTNAASVTRAYGTLEAQGGVNGGDGGRIETSGHLLDIGSAPDMSALAGKGGLWLIDPYNITVVAGGANTNINAASPFVSTGDTASLGIDLINTALGIGDVTISTGSGGGQAGDITWDTDYTYTGGTARSLTLQAYRDIILNQSIISTGGALSLTFTANYYDGTISNDGAGGIVVKEDLTTNGGSLTFSGVGTIFSGSSVQTISTAGGAISLGGETIIANTNGVTLNSANGSITFASSVDSGNSYSYDGTARTWANAYTAAGGAGGAATGSTYLATVTSALEMTAAMAAAGGNTAWLGGSDSATEGTWRWVTGPEGLEDSGAGRIFWTTAQSTGATGYTGYSSRYVNWTSGEPNDTFSNEDALELGFGTAGQWNDYPTASNTLGSLIETNLAASPLTINAGSGAVTFGGAVGTNKALSTLSVTAATTAIDGGAVTTEGLQTYTSDVTVGAAATTLTQTNANTDFTLPTGRNLTTTYGSAATLTINTTRDIAINGTIGSVTNPLGLVFNADSDRSGDGAITVLTDIATAGGSLQFGGDATYTVGTVLGGAGTRSLTTSGGNVTFYGDVLMTTDTAIDTNGAADGSVVFNGKLDSGNTYALSGANTYSWSAAVDDADNVADSYLITITSALENSLARSIAAGNDVWLGGYRFFEDGVYKWRWKTGPEGLMDGGAGLHYFTGVNGGTAQAVPGVYNNWGLDAEGLDNSGPAMQMWYNGGVAKWDDTTPDNTKYYIRETGGTLRTLTVNAGDATVTFEGAVGSTSALKDLAVTAATTAINGGAVTTDSGAAAGGQSYSGDITLGSADTVMTMLDTPTNFTVVSGTSITNASGADAGLTIKTTAGIVLDTNSSITSSSGKLNTVFWSDTDNNADGYISIVSGSSITTNGGNITLGGGTDPAGDYAVGNATQRAGVYLLGGLNAGGGNISVRGQGLSNGGAGIDGGAGTGNIQTSGSGTIAMTGIGYDLGLADGATGYGIWFSGRTISTAGGALSLTGTSHNAAGANNCWGIDLNTASVASTNGDITLTGDSDNAAWYGTSTYLSNIGTTGTGSVTQISNSGKTWVGTLTTTGSGDVTITAASTIERDAGAPATQVGGDLTMTANGAINDPGQITVTGTTQITAGAANDITLTNTGNDFTGAVSVVSGNNVAITDADALTLGAVNAAGTVDIATLTGDLTLTGAVGTTNATEDAIALNAGKSTAAGTSSGGNIIISGGNVSTGAGGRATLYSGDVSDSTGLTGLIGSGTGNFRYNSDESATNFSTDLETGVYAVYRERPTMTTTATNDSKTYDGLAYAGGNGVTYSGFVNGDTTAVLGGTLAYGGTSQDAINAGTYAITPSGYTNGLGYALAYTNGTLTVNKKTVTLSAAKTYDGTTDLSGDVTVTTGVGAETLAYTGAAASNAHVATAGKYISAITLTDGTGLADNYALPTLNAANAPVTISAATLTPTLSNASDTKTYDGTTDAPAGFTPTYTFAGLVSGDTNATLAHTGAAYNDKDVADASTLTVSGLSISAITGSNASAASDYALDANSKGIAATITAKELTVDATAANKTYDGSTTATVTGYGLAGFVGTETVTAGSTAAVFDTRNAGTDKTVTISGITLADGTNGGLAANYSVADSTTATADITPAVLTVTANNDTKIFDDIPYAGGNSVQVSGLVAGETIADLGGTLTYTGTSQGALTPGTYAITPAGLTSGNYAISFLDGLLSIFASTTPESVISSLVSQQTGTNGTGQSTMGGTVDGLTPSMGPGAGSITLATYETTTVVSPPFQAGTAMTLSSATQTAAVSFVQTGAATTLEIGALPSGPLVEVGALPVFSQTASAPAILEGTYIVRENPSTLSLTPAPPMSSTIPDVSSIAGVPLPFTLTLASGISLELSAAVTPQGILMIMVPEAATDLDLNQVVLMGLQVARQEMKKRLAEIRSVLVVKE